MSFQQNSFFDFHKQFWGSPEMFKDSELKISKEQQAKGAIVTLKQFEDWCHRVQTAADEAGDAHLLALESDLLDLRDELLVEMHAAI